MLHETLTEKIIKAFYTVYNALGYGFLEKVYENALVIELEKSNLPVEQQKTVTVFYEGVVVGQYFTDVVVADTVVVELKAAESLCESHRAQLQNYLRSTRHEVGLLLNFGKDPEFERILFTNDRKDLNTSSQSNA